MKILQAFAVGKAFDRTADSLIEIVDDDLRRAVIHDSASVQVRNAHADRITVADEGKLLAFGPPRDKLTLEDHVTGFHVNLVKNAQRKRPVLNDIRNRVNRGAKVDLLLVCQSHENI